MAKNAQEIQALKDKVHAAMQKNAARWSGEMANVPLFAGDTITLTGETDTIKSTTPGVPDWDAFLTKEGFPISYSQLFRKGNGLKFPANVKTPTEAADALIDKIGAMDDGLPLNIRDVKKRESSTRNTKNTYMFFEPIEI